MDDAVVLMAEALPAYLLLGVIAGVLAGMLGVGGGLVIVPVLALLFAKQGFNDAIVMHLAIGTSLATIIVTSISSLRAHHKRGAVEWAVVGQLAPGIIVGAWLGAVIAHLMPTIALRTVFGVFELVVALQMVLQLSASAHCSLPGPWRTAAAGTVIGAISAIVGIGGGTMTVPFLTWCNVEMRRAVATSAAVGLPIALSGAIAYLVNGWHQASLPLWSSGYLYWPALFGITLTSVLFAPLGARLAHTLPIHLLKRIFALLLLALGIRMLLL